MTQALIHPAPDDRTPALFRQSPDAGKRFWEFFTVTIRNRNTRRAYYQAITHFNA